MLSDFYKQTGGARRDIIPCATCIIFLPENGVKAHGNVLNIKRNTNGATMYGSTKNWHNTQLSIV